MILQYFGTSLSDAGHYLWELGRDSMHSSRLRFSDLPFNPEGLPYIKKEQLRTNGMAIFYQFAGFSIWAIEGSCRDTRPNSKSIFFVEAMLPCDEFKQYILNNTPATKIINQMPFKVQWW